MHFDLLEVVAEKALLCGRLERAHEVIRKALAQRSCECLPSSGCTKATVYAEMSELLAEPI